MNEPWSYSVGGYEKGNFAPGRCSDAVGKCPAGDSGIEPYIVTHNMLLAHAAATKLYHDIYKVLIMSFKFINYTKSVAKLVI